MNTNVVSPMESLIEYGTLKALFIILAIGLWLNWLWSRRHLYKFSMKLPTLFGLPIIGYTYKCLHPKDILPLITRGFEKCQADTVCVWMGSKCYLFTRDPETIKNVLSSPELLNKSDVIYDSINDVFKGGLFASPAEEWQHNRKLINPSLNHKVLLSFLPIFNKGKKKMISKFSSIVGMGERKLSHMLQQIAMEITLETTMGKIVNEEDEKDRHTVQNLEIFLESVVHRVMLSVIKLQGLLIFYKRYQKSIKYFQNFIDELIRTKLQIIKANSSKENQVTMAPKDLESDLPSAIAYKEGMESDNLSIKKQPNIFIDQAIQLYQRSQFTFNDIFSESMTMVAASYETTSNTIFNSLVMLAMHPEVQEKLYEEIVNVFPDKDFEMTNDDMTKLPYLDMVVNETLRLIPPVPIIARQVVKDTELTKDMLLPKDLGVMICIIQLHRNTKVWGPNAHKFNPDNFLPENVSSKHSHAFIPFSKGARNCIGWRYAYLQIKTMLVAAVRNFRFSTSFKFEDLRWMTHITLKYLVEPKLEIHNR